MSWSGAGRIVASATLAAASLAAGSGPRAGAASIATVAIGDAAIAEGTVGQRVLTFPVTFSAPLARDALVRYRVVAQAATAGVDFKATNALRSLTFKRLASGLTPVTKWVSVPILPDTTVEPDETFRVELSSPSLGLTLGRATATGTIVNDDPIPNGFRISVSDASIVEGAEGVRAAKFTVALSQPAPARVSVDYTVQARSATGGVDFVTTTKARRLTYVPNRTGLTPVAKTVTVNVLPDAIVEGDETFAVVLANPVGGVFLADATGIGRIVDDDGTRRPAMGAAVRWPTLASDTDYGAIAGRRFDVVVPENELKWDATEPHPGVYSFAAADAIVGFAAEHGQDVHGHALAWHAQNPAWLTNGSFTREELIAILESHIGAVVGHFRGKVAVWDVVNEAIGDDAQPRPSVWSQGIGPDYLDIAFRAARAADPSAALYINDYAIEGPGPKSDALYALVAGLVARGVPIDGVGFQAHVAPGELTGGGLASQFARYAALGLDVAITELDVRVPIPATPAALSAQAAIYSDASAACVAASNCRSFTTWGFTDRYSWIPSWFPGWGAALPFDDALQTKPAYAALAPYLRNG